MYCSNKFNQKDGRNKYQQVMWLKRLSAVLNTSKCVCYPAKIHMLACHVNSIPWMKQKRREGKHLKDITCSAPQSSLWSSYKHGMLPHPTDVTQAIHLGAPAACGPWGHIVFHRGASGSAQDHACLHSLTHKIISCFSCAEASWMQEHWHQLLMSCSR